MATNFVWIGYHFKEFRIQEAIRKKKFKKNSRPVFSTLFLYISKAGDKENLFAHQKVPFLVTISFILITIMCDSGYILYREVRCWSLLEFKGLKFII